MQPSQFIFKLLPTASSATTAVILLKLGLQHASLVLCSWTCAGQCASLLKLELSKVPPKYDAAVAVAGDLAACVESSWGWVESVAAAGADANADGWSFRSDAVAQVRTVGYEVGSQCHMHSLHGAEHV